MFNVFGRFFHSPSGFNSLFGRFKNNVILKLKDEKKNLRIEKKWEFQGLNKGDALMFSLTKVKEDRRNNSGKSTYIVSKHESRKGYPIPRMVPPEFRRMKTYTLNLDSTWGLV